MPYGVNFNMRTIDDFILWVNRKLGAPMMQVELAHETITLCLYDAVNYANEYGFGFGSFMEYYCFNTVDGVQEYQLPENVMAVIQNIGDGTNQLGSGLSQSESLWSNSNYLVQNGTIQGMNNSVYGGGAVSVGGANQGLLSYYGATQTMDILDMFFSKEYMFRYQEPRNALLLTPTPTKVHAVMMKVYTRALPTNLLNNHNVKNLALAYAKQIWGRVLTKYSLTLPGGATVDGASILSEGREDATILEENIRLESEGLGYFTHG